MSVPSPHVGLLRRAWHRIVRAFATLIAPPPGPPAALLPPIPAPVALSAPACVAVRIVYWGGPLDGADVDPMVIRELQVAADNPDLHAFVLGVITDRECPVHMVGELDHLHGWYLTPQGGRGLILISAAGAEE